MSSTRTQVYLSQEQRRKIDQLAGAEGVAMAERAGRVAREFGVRLPDALIAATALEHGLSLITRNPKHFDSIRGLRLRSL